MRILPLFIVVVLAAVFGAGLLLLRAGMLPDDGVVQEPASTGLTRQQYLATPEVTPASATVFTPVYTGPIIAGTSATLREFTAADYEVAKNSGQLVVLYYYANWCPICREEFPKASTAFNELTASNVVGFRVNFNDDQTDAAEEALAREHGVAYQHTKVFVKNGQRILKSPEIWEKDQYITEITQAL